MHVRPEKKSGLEKCRLHVSKRKSKLFLEEVDKVSKTVSITCHSCIRVCANVIYVCNRVQVRYTIDLYCLTIQAGYYKDLVEC